MNDVRDPLERGPAIAEPVRVHAAQAATRRGARRRRDPARHAVPVAVVTIALVVTAPLWLIFWLIGALFLMWSSSDTGGVVGELEWLLGIGMVPAPVLVSTVLAFVNADLGKEARTAAVEGRTPVDRDIARMRAGWSVAGVIAGATGAVAYVLFGIVSVVT